MDNSEESTTVHEQTATDSALRRKYVLRGKYIVIFSINKVCDVNHYPSDLFFYLK